MSPKLVLQRRSAWIAGAAALAFLVGANAWFRGRAGSAAATAPDRTPQPAVPVTMTTAQSRDVDVTLEGLGTVTPIATVNVTSRVAGVLAQVCYREGQLVQPNQLLAVVDPRPYQAAVVQAQGQLARDQALLSNAEIDLARYRDAFAKLAVPEQEVATQEATVREYEGTVKLDQGLLQAAQVNLDYTQIRSPIAGRVGLRQIDAGNIVQANGTNALTSITQLQPITIEFTLSQDFLPQVLQGMKGPAPLRVEAFDRANGRQIAEGRLLTIDNQVDPATGTFRLRASFPNADEALWPGAFVDVRLVSRVDRDAVTVPARAVQAGPNGSYLFVIRPDQTVEMREVSVSHVEQGLAVISKGLSAGEHVVLDGQYRLDQGTRVTIQRPSAAEGS